MKQLLALFLFSALMSCTVTKRHHRGGYHIEWKHRYQESSDAAETKQTRATDKEREDISIANTPIVAEENRQVSALTEIATIDAVNTEDVIEKHASTDQLSRPSEITQSPKKKTKKAESRKTRGIYLNDESIENMRKAGWIIMFVGLFLLICVLLASVPGIGAAGTIGQVILYIIFALLGLLLIVLFGPVGAFIFTLCLALFGVMIALTAMIIQKRRKRFYEPD